MCRSWAQLGHDQTITYEPWPTYDPAQVEEANMTIVVQTNGKLRAQFEVPKTTDKDTIIAKAKEAVATHLTGKEIVKEIYVPNKLVNIVIKG